MGSASSNPRSLPAPGVSGGRILAVAVRKEFKSLWRDGRFRIALLAFALLFAGSVAVGLHDAAEYDRNRLASQRIDEQLWIEQGEKDPHSATHYGQYAFRPRSGLSWMDRGIHDFVGVALFLESHDKGLPRHRNAEESALIPAIADLTPAKIILVFLPLFIIILGFGTVSSERERGTLALAAGNGAPPGILLLGKAAALFLVACVVIAIPFALGAAGLLLGGSPPAEGLLRLALLVAVFLVHSLIHVVLTVSASAAFRTSSAALMVLLAYWICAMIVIPRIANDRAASHTPLMTDAEYDQAVQAARRDGIDGNDPRDQRIKRLQGRILAEYEVASIQELPVNYGGIALQDGEDYDNLIFDRLSGRIYDALDKRRSSRMAGSIFGPQIAARILSANLAGTDLNHDREFLREAEQHRRSYVKALNDALAYGERKNGAGYVAGEELWKRTKIPEMQIAPLGKVHGPVCSAWIVLGAWLAIASILFFISAKRTALR